MKRVRFTPAAEADVQKAFQWYEEQSPGLGERFLLSVDRAVSRIARHPLAAARVIADARRVLLEPFPYSLVYRVEGEVIVIACIHGSRDPALLRMLLD